MPETVTITRIQVRQGDKNAWELENPLLTSGEIGMEIDPVDPMKNQLKIGDGLTLWNDLPYLNNIHFGDSTDFADNYVLPAGYFGVERDSGRMKIGDGTTEWLNLNYATLTSTLIAKINEAHSWGDHGAVGYITGVNWADVVGRPTDTDLNNWATAFSWGDHSTFGYLTSVAWDEIIGNENFSLSTHDHHDWYARKDVSQTIDMDVNGGIEWNLTTADITATGVPLKINGHSVWHRGILDTTDFAAAVHGHDHTDITGLHAVAISGAYADLTGTPDLAAVATSGSYNDLVDVPAVSSFDLVSFHADRASFPGSGNSAIIYIDEDQNETYRWDAGAGDYQILDNTLNVWGDITGTLSDQTDLQDALNLKSDVGHGHVIADVTGLQTELDGKALAAHTHIIDDVTGLQTALDGKSDNGHTHVVADITDYETTVADRFAVELAPLNSALGTIEKNFYPNSTIAGNGISVGETEALYSQANTRTLYQYDGAWHKVYAKARSSEMEYDELFLDNRQNTHIITQNQNIVTLNPVAGSVSVASETFIDVQLVGGTTASSYSLSITDDLGTDVEIILIEEAVDQEILDITPQIIQDALESATLPAGVEFVGSVVDGTLRFYRSDGLTFTVKEVITAGTGGSATGDGFPDAFATAAGVVTAANNLVVGPVLLEVPVETTRFTIADVVGNAGTGGDGITVDFTNTVPLIYKGVTHSTTFALPVEAEYQKLTFVSNGTNFYAY